ncbi:hypothetical protein BDU57DRAFT_244520 [Ampelomyces quisqualis]|uniref:DUF2461 domain-containing protein n=1 Tax=Ampelomyces quisqualis TaxID=50730 RepID=A0A6A5QPP8_AMPQU|nr:hypothetical protein BDU57DRAFT_244520 [Ampelomyces quisqualis]
MPRKSTKITPAPTSRSSSKRPAQDTPTRHSKRAKATGRKSYAESGSDDDEDEIKQLSIDSHEEQVSDASDFAHASEVDPTSESEQEEAATSEEDDKPPKATPRGTAVKKSLALHSKKGDEKDLWKSGAKLAPGTQVVIKKPKPREAGDTPFTDDSIHPNTMLFLKDLAANNDRQWLKLHDPDFRASLDDFSTFTEKVTEKVMEADETIPELPVKDVIYRIYRDVRFSKSPTPYKTYFSAAWSRTGRKGPYAHYYIQIQPNGGSFVGGFWQPEAATLAKLRHDIDRKPHNIKQALQNPLVRKAFLNKSEDTEKGAVRAFVNLASNKSNALKRHPKGYDQNHKDIDLLRLRNFTLGKKLRDDEVIGTGGLGRIAELVACMVPFITYLNRVVMPDDEPSDSSEEDGSATGQEEED